MVAMVQSGSVACRAGLQVGDFVLKISGHDTRTADGEIVLRKLKEAVGRTVEVGVARPFPVPVTDKEKMRALLVLQTKVIWLSLSLPLTWWLLYTPSHSSTVAQYSRRKVSASDMLCVFVELHVTQYGNCVCCCSCQGASQWAAFMCCHVQCGCLILPGSIDHLSP